MGIKDLLKTLEPYFEIRSIGSFSGQTAGIDGYTWLHTAFYSCLNGVIEEISMISQIKRYFTDKINLMRSCGIKPIFVFDGDKLPIKIMIEDSREAQRKKRRGEFEKLIASSNFKEAKAKLITAIDITPELASTIIKHLKILKVECIVSPYEADAQLAFLYNEKIVDFVITIDSDLICYGTGKIFYVTNFHKLEGKYIEYSKIFLKGNNPSRDFHMFNSYTFTLMCIFCGCDYVPKLKGVGISTIFDVFKSNLSKLAEFDNSKSSYKSYFQDLIKTMIDGISLARKCQIPSEYFDQITRAFLTFKCQVVYSPIQKKLIFLTLNDCLLELLKSYNNISFLGQLYDNLTATHVANCLIDPTNKQKYDTTTVFNLCSQEMIRQYVHATSNQMTSLHTKGYNKNANRAQYSLKEELSQPLQRSKSSHHTIQSQQSKLSLLKSTQVSSQITQSSPKISKGFKLRIENSIKTNNSKPHDLKQSFQINSQKKNLPENLQEQVSSKKMTLEERELNYFNFKHQEPQANQLESEEMIVQTNKISEVETSSTDHIFRNLLDSSLALSVPRSLNPLNHKMSNLSCSGKLIPSYQKYISRSSGINNDN